MVPQKLRTVGDRTPSVTFLATAYHTEETVAATIESVLRQTRSDWQLIVVDNGMSDEIARIVRQYVDDPRILLIRQENQRLQGGVNAAGRAAGGRYVAVLNTDDLVLPTFVERLCAYLDAAPEVDAVACDARFIAPDGAALAATHMSIAPRRGPSGSPVTLVELIDGFVPYYTALVRRETWEAVGGFRTDAPIEDLAFWIDLVTDERTVHVLNVVLALYRQDENSESRRARGVESVEEAREQIITAAAERTGRSEDAAAVADAIRRSRHRRAVVRARRLLFEDDVDGARLAARVALSERADLRTHAIAWALRGAPRVVRGTYRIKRWARVRAQRLPPRRAAAILGGAGSTTPT